MTPGIVVGSGPNNATNVNSNVFQRLANTVGLTGPVQKVEKPYQTCLTFGSFYEGKHVILTGATGGIGCKVAKKLLKAGMKIKRFDSWYRC